MRYLVDSAVDVLAALVVILPLLCLMMKFLGKKTWIHRICILLFGVYLTYMYNIVGVPACQYWSWSPNFNFIPFVDWGSRRFWFQMIANAVMTMPLGFFLPVLWQRYRRGGRAVLAGFLTSLAIEATQMFCFRATDVDDLMMNTLGASLGYLAARLLFGRKWQTASGDIRREWLELIAVNAVVVGTIILVRTPIAEWINKVMR